MNNFQSFSLLSNNFDLHQFVFSSLKEDIGNGDHTTLSCIPENAKGKSKLIIKDDGIIAGVSLAEKIFLSFDKNLRIKFFLPDGTKVKKGDIAFIVEGSARSILTAERLVLNCMQRMSGIATQTNKLITLCKPYKVKLLDTRKTTPLLRDLEKWAVRIGGGYNHRFGLYDMILIKNNHIDFAGGIKQAVESANAYLKKKKLKLQIEIEARNQKEVKEIISIGSVDRILLDNFSISEIKKVLHLINGKFETEISGGINEKNIRRYASCGADYISVGALTHSVKSLDMSLTAI
ncbi:MAG: carboxylating nicotinate-nucleotide diphosphorylase [Bacteroidetes bacterium]|nr:carboxylating nicotinate-nucleotide diphosphorylase [Bacteroidota bacterium]